MQRPARIEKFQKILKLSKEPKTTFVSFTLKKLIIACVTF
eukprot:UN12435